MTISKTHPTIISLLSQAISKLHLTDGSVEYDETHREGKIQQAIQEQTAIGWKQMFQGRISRAWEQTQYDYFSNNNIINRAIPYAVETEHNKWRQVFILALLQFGLQLWEERNTLFHCSNGKQCKHNRRMRAVDKARDLFIEGEASVGH